MTDETKKPEEEEKWYPGKYFKKAAKATWEGAKQVGKTVAEHPVAGTVGAVGGFMVGGPLGAAGGAVAAAGVAKVIKEEKTEEEKKDKK